MSHIDDHESKDELDQLRHSTAHVLAAAVTELWPGTKYAIGPPVENGFYYDFESDHQFTPEDFKEIEKKMRSIVGRDLPFAHEWQSKPEAIATFRALGQDYKVELIEDRIADDEQVSLYRTGEDFLDLCRGPHVPGAGAIRAFKLLRVAGAYWKGDEHNRQLQRIYGTAWPSQKEQDEYLEMLAEAERRDHKKLGRELKLFHSDERSGAGLPLWLPNGATVRREIERWVVDEELKRGYQHVLTPNLARLELYERSGHWQKYHDSMYPPMRFEESGEVLELRPMNCPHHILVYESEMRSYRDLPLRIAEVGMNYRYERSGTLQGMNRVRAFALNDAHIFCTPEQVEQEVKGAIELSLHFSEVLGIDDFWYRLSTRDDVKDKWIGTAAEWETAQAALSGALESLSLQYRLGPGEAAFYGPKIDFQVRDALRREFTNSTVQVDFELPQLFDLEYVAEDGSRKRPVMVHRGAAGSMERLFAYLIERWAGAFPTWMAPTQVVVIPITDEQNAYAASVAERLRRANVRVLVDASSDRMQRKIRDAQRMKVPYMAIVGGREVESGQVNVRNRVGNETPEALEDFAARLTLEITEKRRPDR
ncbi:MAG TPA: threonine--tRNA ligase [Candidatus Dormibacteraeota bacterium]|nr:threonine--tRNA ligase [Candidatus Dormibacteraeota bacterium]